MIHRYSAGTFLGVIGSRGVALLSPEVGPQVAEGICRLLQEETDVGTLVESLTASAGTGLTGIPPFAFALREGSSVRVAVRGPLQVTVRCGASGAPMTVSGEGATVLAERVIESVVRTEVSPTSVPEAVDDGLTVAGGVIMCGRIVTSWTDPGSAIPGDDLADPNQTLPPPIDGPGAVAPVPEGVDDGEAPAEVHFEQIWGSSLSDLDGEESNDLEPVEPVVAAVEPILDEHSQPSTPASPAVEILMVPPPTPLPPAPSPSKGMSIPDTPTRDGMIVGVPDFGIPAQVVPPAHTIHEVGEKVSEPGSAAPPMEEVPASPSVDPGDHGGDTITAEDLRELRVPEPAGEEGVPSRPPERHPRVVLSTGQCLNIDQGIVFGRRPTVTRVTGDLPQLVSVSSPNQDVSRNHLEIRQEGSVVMATDLGSTNGTVLLRAGRDPLRLHPREATVLFAGDVLELGDGVTITFLEDS